MKNLILSIILSVLCVNLFSIESIRLFDPIWFSYEKKADGSRSNVLSVVNEGQFISHVVNSDKPAVVSVFIGGDKQTPFLRNDFQKVSDSFKGRISFVSMEYAQNKETVQSVLSGLHQRGLLKTSKISLPLLLFFKQKGVLVQLHAGGAFSEKLLINMIKQSILEKPGDGETSPSFKHPTFFDKLKRWFVGMRDVSKEVGAYQQSKRWKQRKRFGI